MVDSNLLDYIKRTINLGNSKEAITAALLNAGWNQFEIDEGFKEAEQVALKPSVSRKPMASVSSQPKEVKQPLEVKQSQEIKKPVQVKQSEEIDLDDPDLLPFDSPQKFSPKIIISIVAVVLLLLLIGGGLYFYFNKSNVAAISPYTEKNIFSGLLGAASKINTASYSVLASLAMNQRDAGAQPFLSKLSNANEIKKQYEHDSQRAKDVSSMLAKLSSLNYNNNGTYAASLGSLLSTNNTVSITDPSTLQPYGYGLTENGKNFSLTVTFQTNNAINQIRKSYRFSDVTTIINNKTVTFTKDSYPYIYLSSIPPKPFLVTLADWMAYFPPDGKASLSASAQSDFANEDSANWKFNMDATGDFGDLTYKMNVDALRKDTMYYVKVNNFPDLFFSYFGLVKDQWIKIDPSKPSPSSYSPLSGLPSLEKSYRENRQKITDLFRKMITIADEESVFTFKNAPSKEDVNGRTLYRYDLAFRKEAIVPFYERFLEESSKSGVNNYFPYPPLTDSGYLEYLQSPEFSEVFDYYQKNTSLTLWTDLEGFPAILSYGMRVVPTDSIEHLKDKQANVVFTLELSDINKPVIIQAPTDAKNYEDLFPTGTYSPSSLQGSQTQSDSTIKANLSMIFTNATSYRNANGSYANFCTKTNYTSPAISITAAGGSPICKVNATNTAFCACSSLKDAVGDVFCVDSTGTKRQTTNTCVSACTTSGVCGN